MHPRHLPPSIGSHIRIPAALCAREILQSLLSLFPVQLQPGPSSLQPELPWDGPQRLRGTKLFETAPQDRASLSGSASCENRF